MKTLTDKIALAISLWVVLAGTYAGYVNPERRWQCLLGMAVLGLAWAIRHAFRSKGEPNPALDEARLKITQSISFAGMLLSIGLFEALGWVAASGEFRVRSSQFLAGAMVMVFANAIPKKAVSSRRLASLLRANGRVMFVGGLGYALAWLLLPLAYANEVAIGVMLLAFAYVLARIVLCAVSRDRSTPPTGPA